MSNHDHPCRGCGDDLRLIGSAHEADCLARKLDEKERLLSAAIEGGLKLESRLDSARKYCEEQIAGNSDWNEWVKGWKDGLEEVLKRFLVVEKPRQIAHDGDCNCDLCE